MSETGNTEVGSEAAAFDTHELGERLRGLRARVDELRRRL